MGEEDLYIGEEESEGGDEESSNRTFILIMAGLAALFVCTVVLIILYWAVIGPNLNKGKQAVQLTVIAQNATAMIVMTEAARSTDTPEPTNTPLPTNTPMPATNTPVIVTPSATPTPTNTPGPATATLPPQAGGATATKTVSTKTAAGASTTGTPGANPDQMADTGIGGIGLVVLAVGLVAVLFIARRLRMAQR